MHRAARTRRATFGAPNRCNPGDHSGSGQRTFVTITSWYLARRLTRIRLHRPAHPRNHSWTSRAAERSGPHARLGETRIWHRHREPEFFSEPEPPCVGGTPGGGGRCLSPRPRSTPPPLFANGGGYDADAAGIRGDLGCGTITAQSSCRARYRFALQADSGLPIRCRSGDSVAGYVPIHPHASGTDTRYCRRARVDVAGYVRMRPANGGPSPKRRGVRGED